MVSAGPRPVRTSGRRGRLLASGGLGPRCPADDLVDVAVGRPVVVPGRVAVDLGLAEVERTPGGQQGGPRRGEVLHQVADARCIAEERVVVLGQSRRRGPGSRRPGRTRPPRRPRGPSPGPARRDRPPRSRRIARVRTPMNRTARTPGGRPDPWRQFDRARHRGASRPSRRARGRASRPPRPGRRDPSRRRGASPWVTSSRSSSAGDQRTSPVWPPRPGRRLVDRPARPTRRCRRGAVAARAAGRTRRRPATGPRDAASSCGRERVRRQQRERQDVGRARHRPCASR